GEEVLEAAAAARDHQHVEVGLAAQRPKRLDDRARRSRALHVGLGDEDAGRREPGRDRGQDVSLGGRVVAGDEADPAREEREWALALRREQALVRELALQALQRGQMIAEAEPLERKRPEPELAARLEELGPPVDVDAVSVGELEPEGVEPAARHRDPEAGAVRGVLEREEDARPALLAAELGHLA